ncbi:MAG: kinase/pyrophosphorylase [Gammaproteobacteria bacterium]|nr:kinase/pyrophosphorylase [Gammaproteobacteria bacterium]
MKRTIFFLSDRTGITAEALGETLLTQFPGVDFVRTSVPFLTSPDKAMAVLARIQAAERNDGAPPIVFSTLTDPQSQAVIASGTQFVFDLFGTWIEPLEKALGTQSSHTAGQMHGISDVNLYLRRVDALNFTLDHDDGLRPRDMHEADVILIGVSRSGKTPTCLYMAMHYHLKAANYPLDADELRFDTLPPCLRGVRDKLYGLSIDAEHLSRIRHGRRPNSRYASVEQCRTEVAGAQSLFRAVGIPYIDTTSISIEEIATTIQQHFAFARPYR